MAFSSRFQALFAKLGPFLAITNRSNVTQMATPSEHAENTVLAPSIGTKEAPQRRFYLQPLMPRRLCSFWALSLATFHDTRLTQETAFEMVGGGWLSMSRGFLGPVPFERDSATRSSRGAKLRPVLTSSTRL